MPKAASLADELREEFTAEVKLIPGSGGVFDVVFNGKKIFSKFDTYRFPQPGEIVDLINNK
ncbi:Rdx family protein [candidate division KSB1 bacterium]|nr:Rdx family protein [candidate division KSB1 bacterium]